MNSRSSLNASRHLTKHVDSNSRCFLAGDYAEASRLVARKAQLRGLEARAMVLHVRLLREAAISVRAEDGDRIGLVAEEGGQFLRIVRDLRQVHSHIATLACPLGQSA